MRDRISTGDAEELTAGQAQLDETRRELEAERGSLESERRDVRERNEALNAQESRHIETEQRLVARAANLDARQEALKAQALAAQTTTQSPPAEDPDWLARRTQFEHERQAWNDAREQGDAEYARQLEKFEEQLETLREREARLESQRDEHEKREESLRERTAKLEATQSELSAQPAQTQPEPAAEPDRELAETWAVQQAEIEQAREQLQRDREELETDRAQSRERLERQLAELQELRDELEQARADLQSSREAGQRKETTVSIVEEEEQIVTDDERSTRALDADNDDDDVAAVAEEPSSVEEQDELEEDEAEEEETPAVISPARSQRSGASPANSEEPSIDDYMAELLKRMRGDKAAEVVIAPQPRRNKPQVGLGSGPGASGGRGGGSRRHLRPRRRHADGRRRTGAAHAPGRKDGPDRDAGAGQYASQHRDHAVWKKTTAPEGGPRLVAGTALCGGDAVRARDDSRHGPRDSHRLDGGSRRRSLLAVHRAGGRAAVDRHRASAEERPPGEARQKPGRKDDSSQALALCQP